MEMGSLFAHRYVGSGFLDCIVVAGGLLGEESKVS